MKKEEILAKCIEEIQSGRSTIEGCVARHPEMGKELRARLELITYLKPDEVVPSQEFRLRAERHLFDETRPALIPVSHSLWSWPRLSPARIIATALVIIIVLGVAGGGTVYASQGTLPGDALYSVKTTAENIQLAITPGALSKADLHLKLAQRRIDEATRQTELKRTVNVEALLSIQKQFDEAIKEINNSDDNEQQDEVLSRFASLTLNQQLELQQISNDTSETNKAILKKALDLTRRGNLVAQVAYTNRDFLGSQPSVLDENLEVDKFKIEGTLLDIQGTNWNVGGVILIGVHFSGKLPTVGSRVNLEGIVKNHEVYLFKVEAIESTLTSTEIEGQIDVVNNNGTVNVGGISVQITNNSNVDLKPGDKVQIQSSGDNNELNITSKESDNEDGDNTRISGILSKVNVSTGTITISSSGNQITINVSKAQMVKDGGDVIRLVDIEKYIGNDIEIEGLYKKDGIIFATHLTVKEDD